MPSQEFLLKLKRDYLTPHVLVPAAILAVVIYFFLPERSIQQPPGILAAQAPVLTVFPAKASLSYKGYDITPLADYDLTARVLDKAYYYWGNGADIAPVDMLLGWKFMSDSSTLKYFSFHLSNRWYTWRASQLPYAEDEVNNNLDNNHLIPSTSVIERQIKNTEIGQIIHMQGFLVSVDGKNGFNWRSSMNIGSTGGNLSCKLIYVTKIETIR